MTVNPQPTRRAWVVWSAGVLAYVVAILNRTSFGVAGLEAQHRFDAGPGVLSIFVVLQLFMYAGLQIPVGVLIDRFGPRVLLVSGGLVMALGQTILATSGTLGLALGGRALVGAGDATVFISVLRLIGSWFPARQVPVLSQVTGQTGLLGQIASAFPLTWLLHGPGWLPAFASVAAMGVLAAIVVLLVVRDTPTGVRTRAGASARDVLTDIAEAWRHPGTRLGLWSHFSTPFAATAFALLWGVPFLVAGEGLTRGQAGALLTLFVVAAVVTGPVLGVAVSRHPLRRSKLVLGLVALGAGAWTVVLAWPGRAPLWLLAVLVVAISVGGPGSVIGFDFARTFNPEYRHGTATGVVNVGGFVSALVAVLAIGWVLDVRTGGAVGEYSLDDFRWAFAVQYPLWAIGVVGILRSRALVRRRRREAAGPPS
ncbi:MAG: MFS transporter [Kineosporiaceae bacterium]